MHKCSRCYTKSHQQTLHMAHLMSQVEDCIGSSELDCRELSLQAATMLRACTDASMHRKELGQGVQAALPCVTNST